MKNFLLFLFATLVISACNKDKFKTEPQVEIRSINPAQVTKGQFIKVALTIRDKEGDLQDSLLLVRKWFTGTTLLTHDTLRYTLSGMGFPVKQTIDVEVMFAYGELVDGTIYIPLEQVEKNFSVGFIMRDQAGNKSTYVESDKIVLRPL